MSNPKECRRFRANFRNGILFEQEIAKKHIATCPECRKAIEASQNNNPDTTYKGKSIGEVIKNVTPSQQTERSIWE